MSDEDLVTRAIRDVEPLLLNPRGAAHLAAVAVAALSAAGRLLPEGGAEHTEWAVNADGSSLGRGPIPTVGDVPAGRVMVAELRRKYGVEAWLESRTVRTFSDGSVLTGPWNEVTE